MFTLLLLPFVLADVLVDPVPTPDAAKVAKRVADACGPVYQKERVAFTFVVTVDGVEKARRRHEWSPTGNTLRVSWEGVDVAFSRLNPPTAPGVADELRDDAWGAFINDSYWLLAACKATDTGVMPRVEGPDSLTLAFQGVGLTPGDQYTLELDDRAGVKGWSYVLQSGNQASWDWLDYKSLGGLNLSLTRRQREGGRVITFEEVEVR